MRSKASTSTKYSASPQRSSCDTGRPRASPRYYFVNVCFVPALVYFDLGARQVVRDKALCTCRGKKCQGHKKALLTNSGTGALELCAICIGAEPGAEVILPSFTFVSTANAFVTHGATPVLVDIRADTQNIDETKIEAAMI